jgi:hypothetical protein
VLQARSETITKRLHTIPSAENTVKFADISRTGLSKLLPEDSEIFSDDGTVESQKKQSLIAGVGETSLVQDIAWLEKTSQDLAGAIPSQAATGTAQILTGTREPKTSAPAVTAQVQADVGKGASPKDMQDLTKPANLTLGKFTIFSPDSSPVPSARATPGANSPVGSPIYRSPQPAQASSIYQSSRPVNVNVAPAMQPQAATQRLYHTQQMLNLAPAVAVPPQVWCRALSQYPIATGLE